MFASAKTIAIDKMVTMSKQQESDLQQELKKVIDVANEINKLLPTHFYTYNELIKDCPYKCNYQSIVALNKLSDGNIFDLKISDQLKFYNQYINTPKVCDGIKSLGKKYPKMLMTFKELDEHVALYKTRIPIIAPKIEAFKDAVQAFMKKILQFILVDQTVSFSKENVASFLFGTEKTSSPQIALLNEIFSNIQLFNHILFNGLQYEAEAKLEGMRELKSSLPHPSG